MSLLFQTIHTILTDKRNITVEPVLSICLNYKGWQNAGSYKIYNSNELMGFIHFEGDHWRFDGAGLDDTQQEELAYFIRYYDGEAA